MTSLLVEIIACISIVRVLRLFDLDLDFREDFWIKRDFAWDLREFEKREKY
jgi:hypothetical protein